MISLRTPKDVKEVRIALLQEQNGKDLITGLKLEAKDAVCDHDHNTQMVRGVLHRQVNVLLGKIENAWVRYLKWWYNGNLPDLLRHIADYLERPTDKRYAHPKWQSNIKTRFNKLTATNQSTFLQHFLNETGNNLVKRKLLLNKVLKSYGFDVCSKQMKLLE